MNSYQHLPKEERFYIWQARREGNTQTHIAKALGRHPSTICRELKRNRYAQCQMYTYHWASQIMKHSKPHANRHKYCKLNAAIAPLITDTSVRKVQYTFLLSFHTAWVDSRRFMNHVSSFKGQTETKMTLIVLFGENSN